MKTTVWLFGLSMLVAANIATAQGNAAPKGRPVELWGAITGVVAGPAGSLTSSYSPPLLFDGDFTSRAGQTLAAATGFAFGFTGGVNVFPSNRVGIQVLFDRASSDVSAANTPYAYALQYVSHVPPNNDAQTVNVSQAIAWPDTSGSLTQTAVAFNATVRIGRPDRLSATISGGPTFYRLSGTVQPLGFTAFHLGGHSVLFQDDYRLALELEPANSVGFDAGVDIDLPVGRHTFIIAGYRYFGGPEAEARVSSMTVINPDEITFELPIADIASRLALAPTQISVSSSRLFVGVKFTP
jgi:hypothetical protein